jgi:hypothetical protein
MLWAPGELSPGVLFFLGAHPFLQEAVSPGHTGAVLHGNKRKGSQYQEQALWLTLQRHYEE